MQSNRTKALWEYTCIFGAETNWTLQENANIREKMQSQHKTNLKYKSEYAKCSFDPHSSNQSRIQHTLKNYIWHSSKTYNSLENQ